MNPKLNLELIADHQHLEQGKEQVMHLCARILAGEVGVEAERPPLTVVFVLDVSASMEGAPLEHARRSTMKMIEMLRPQDRAGVVAFSERAEAVAPVVEADTRGLMMLRSGVERLRTIANTNLEAGLRLAQQVMPPRRLHERQLVLLLSDGVPNCGVTDPERLAMLARERRPLVCSTLGYGPDHCEPVLSGLAGGGGGTYHYVRDPAIASVEFARALGAQGDVVAEQVQLELSPRDGVEVLALVPSTPSRIGPRGLLVELPDLVARATHRVAVRLRVRAGREPGVMGICELALRYRPAGGMSEAREERSVELPVRPAPAALVAAAVHEVLVLRAEEVRRAARTLGDQGRYSEAVTLLREVVASIEAAPGFAAGSGTPLAEAWDQLRDDADLYLQHPDPGAWAEFRRGQQLGSGGRFEVDSMAAVAGASRRLIDAVAGDLPRAVMVNLAGGERYPLDKAIIIIGRARGADIYIPSSLVSRQSARIVAQGGRFWLEDLGSANGTFIGGRKISRHCLVHGDVVTVGSALLRYEVA